MRNRRTVFLYLFAAMLFSAMPNATLFAQDRNDSLRQIDVAAVRGPLYQFSKDGQTHYLLGTFHLGRADFFPMDWGVNSALSKSELVLVEIQTTRAEIAADFDRYWVEHSQSTRRLSEATMSRMRAQATRLRYPEKLLVNAKPWVPLVQFPLYDAKADGLTPDYATETYVEGFANAIHRDVESLESMQSQAATFDAMSEAALNTYADSTLNALEDGTMRTQVQTLLRYWESGDVENARASIDKEMPPSAFREFFVDELIGARNRKLATQIMQRSQTRKLFVAVGMLHLGGPEGLLAQLRSAGFKVEHAPRGLDAKPKSP